MPLLSEEEIAIRLESLNNWQRDENMITCFFKFGRFSEGIDFVRRVAEIADNVDHHPDIDIRFTNIKLSLCSHDAGGITEKDFMLAERINSLVIGK